MQVYSNELYHYGVIGMKWGIRRYQNPDGSLKAAGRKRYDQAKTAASNAAGKVKAVARRPVDAVKTKVNSLTDEQKVKIKKGVKIGLAVAGTALAAYGAYKIGSKAMARHKLSGKVAAQKLLYSTYNSKESNGSWGLWKVDSINSITDFVDGTRQVYNLDGKTGKEWAFDYKWK